MSVRQTIEAGLPAKARPLARELGVSPSLIYDMIQRGEIEARRIGLRRLVIPNAAARKLLGMEPQQAA
ncbi:helix-turn-helix domain-containing protein [Methylobacterium sp. WL122]|nr:helix-turn-helix domain-containing protein [Methylobacterium sp. WL122]